MNTEDVHLDGAFCAYWTDGVGDKFTGSKYTIQVTFSIALVIKYRRLHANLACRHTGNSVLCI